MGQKHKPFREFRTPFPLRDIRAAMYARVPQAMAQFVLKIEKLSHIMAPTPILEIARAYGLHPRLWLLIIQKTINGELRKSPMSKFYLNRVDRMNLMSICSVQNMEKSNDWIFSNKQKPLFKPCF